MITMTTRRRNLDVLLDLKTTRYRSALFRRANRYRRPHQSLAARLQTRVRELLEKLGCKCRMSRRRIRGNAYRRPRRAKAALL